MADLALGTVTRISGTVQVGISSAALAAGDVVALNTVSNKLGKLDANSGLPDLTLKGIVIFGCDAGNKTFSYVADGVLDVGVAVVRGTIYVCSANAGKIAPFTDLAAGWETFIVAVGSATANRLELYMFQSNATV